MNRIAGPAPHQLTGSPALRLTRPAGHRVTARVGVIRLPLP